REASGFDGRDGQTTLFRLHKGHRPHRGGGVQCTPTAFELRTSNGDVPPVIGRGMSLLDFLDQVFEVMKGRNGRAGSAIDESRVFSCDPEVNGALDALKGNAAATPFRKRNKMRVLSPPERVILGVGTQRTAYDVAPINLATFFACPLRIHLVRTRFSQRVAGL